MKLIAEVGVNHNGSFSIAKKYIDTCKKIGVDFVKFQVAVPDYVVLKNAHKAKYQIKTTNNKESQFDMLKNIHLTIDEYSKLYLYSKKKKK